MLEPVLMLAAAIGHRATPATRDAPRPAGCAVGLLSPARVLPGAPTVGRLVASGVQVDLRGAGGDRSRCSVARLSTPLTDDAPIVRVDARVHYRLARTGPGTAQLIAIVNGVPGLAVATDPFGEGVLPITVLGDRFDRDRRLDLSLFLQGDRRAPEAVVAAEVHDVTFTVTEGPMPPAKPPKQPPRPRTPPAKKVVYATRWMAAKKEPPATPPPTAPLDVRILPATSPATSARMVYDLHPAAVALDDRWTAAAATETIPVRTLVSRAWPGNRDRDTQRSLALTVPLRDAVALDGRTTRVTLVWSALKEGWAEGWVELAVNGKTARVASRAVQSATAGQRLPLNIPATSVRTAQGLNITISVGSRQRGPNSVSTVSVDALGVEVGK